MAKNKHSRVLPFHPEGHESDGAEDDGGDGENEFPQTQFDSSAEGPMWDAKAILKERGKKYLVDWSGIDPANGKPYKPTWEPKSNCTNALIKSWKKHQAEERRRTMEEAANDSSFDPKPDDQDTKGKGKRKRKTSEAASEPASVVKRPRPSRGRVSAASSSSSSTRLRQLDLEPSSAGQSSADAESNLAVGGPDSDDGDTPRTRRSTYSRKKSAAAKEKKKKAVVDSDDDSHASGEDDEMRESDDEAPVPTPKKRGRPRKSVPQPEPASDEDSQATAKAPEPKRPRRTRQSAPFSYEQEEPEEDPAEEEPESQETDDTVPATPSPADADGSNRTTSEKPLSTVVEEDEPEQEAEQDEEMMDDDQDAGWGHAYEQFGADGDHGAGYQQDDDPDHDVQPEPGPSGTTLIDEGEDDEDINNRSVDADTSRGTVIPDSQELPLSPPIRADRSASAESATGSTLEEAVPVSSQVDEIESTQEEEIAAVVAPVARKPKALRPVRDHSPPQIRSFAPRASHLAEEESPMSSQIEEYTSSSLENRAKRIKANAVSRMSAPIFSVNAEAGPSRPRQPERAQIVDDDGDRVEMQPVMSSVASSIEADTVSVVPTRPSNGSSLAPVQSSIAPRPESTATAASKPVDSPAPAPKVMVPLSSVPLPQAKKKFNFSHASTSNSNGTDVVIKAAVDRAYAADAAAGGEFVADHDDAGGAFDHYDDDYGLNSGGEVEGDVPEADMSELVRERSMDIDEVVAPPGPNGIERAASPPQPVATGANVVPLVDDTLEEETIARLVAAEAGERDAKSKLVETETALLAAQAQIRALEARAKDKESDSDFFREQYRDASGIAAKRSDELRDAEALITKLQGQLDVGIRQQETVSLARIAKVTEEKDQALLRVSILTEQSRLTGDALRQKAARVPVLEKTINELENSSAENEDFRELAEKNLADLETKYNALKRKMNRANGNVGPSTSAAGRRPSPSRSDDSGSDSEDGSYRDSHQGGGSFRGRGSDEDESGSEAGFRPSTQNNTSPRASAPRMSSRRSAQIVPRAATVVTKTTLSLSQISVPPSPRRKSTANSPQRRAVPIASQITDSDSSSSSSDVAIIASSSKKVVAVEPAPAREDEMMEIEDERTPERELDLDGELDLDSLLPLPAAMALCRWGDPNAECGAAFGSLEELEVHAIIEHV